MNEFTVRVVNPTDAAEVERILNAAHLAASVPIGPKWSRAQIVDECSRGGWVAAGRDGRLRGFLLMRELPDAFEISFLASDSNSARTGVMSNLVATLFSALPKEKAVWLEVHENNLPARRFYEKMGFRHTGTRPRYYSDGGAAVLYNYG